MDADDQPLTLLQLCRALAAHAAHTSLSHAVREVGLSEHCPTRAEWFYLGTTLAQLGRTQAARDAAWLRGSALPTPEATEMGSLWYAARMLLWLGDSMGFETEMEAVFRTYPRPGIAAELATHYNERGQVDKCRAFCHEGIALYDQQRRSVDATGEGS
jgi:hypothetical protein